jgi:hypothetical protein
MLLMEKSLELHRGNSAVVTQVCIVTLMVKHQCVYSVFSITWHYQLCAAQLTTSSKSVTVGLQATHVVAIHRCY